MKGPWVRFNGAATNWSRKLSSKSPLSAHPLVLQWGRDQLVAEMVHSRSVVIESLSLQWGRDQLVAEIPLKDKAIAIRVTLQWGRDQLVAEMVHSRSVVIESLSLQWGRDQLVAEMHYMRLTHSTCFASMGPRPIGRGNDP